MEIHEVLETLREQSDRCKKPHFQKGTPWHRDDQRIDDWNSGVASLAREFEKALRVRWEDVAKW